MQDKEQQIKLQFLDEAQEYVDRLESGLFNLQRDSLASGMNEMLRAAHSLKGGSAMMGYTVLSEFSHRLEDFFKVIKSGKTTIDNHLESLLLITVDSFKQMIATYRTGNEVKEEWLSTQVEPVFARLQLLVGDVQIEDNVALLQEESGEDMSVILFQTEIDKTLSNLETLLQETPEGVYEEFLEATTALQGIGEILELPDFVSMCTGVIQELTDFPHAVVQIGERAIASWRQYQEMILTAKELGVTLLSTNMPLLETNAETDMPTLIPVDELLPVEVPIPTVVNDHPTVSLRESTENSIRVPLPTIEQLSELFGELTIERNGLELQLKHLRYLVDFLSEKVSNLEKSNFSLRNAYDRVSTAQPASSFTSKFDLLEMDRYDDVHILSGDMMESVVQIQEVTKDIEIELESTERQAREIKRTSKLMQNNITKVRMRPFADLVSRFPIALRQMCLNYGKEVELRLKGTNTLVDRTILESLNEPLLHLLRNAFDHGIEDAQTRSAAGKPLQGTIEITAAYRGNRTIIVVKDDGGGIDVEKIRTRVNAMGVNIPGARERDLINLIFEPGFSTSEKVTSLSGRGVGMDVVRTNIQKLGGEISVDTRLGEGTTFTISVPYNLSVMRVLLVESQGMWLAVPTNAVEEMVLVQSETVIHSTGQELLDWEGFIVPLYRLSKCFTCSHIYPRMETETSPVIDQATLLMVTIGDGLAALEVDRYWGEQEVTIRQVEGNLPLPPGLSGCTILGDGRVVPLLDAVTLIDWLDAHGSSYSSSSSTPTLPIQSSTKTIMIVDDSINVRRFLALTLEKAGWEVEQAKDGLDAMEKLHSGIVPHAIICDIEMPRLDGYGFLARINAEPKYENIPVFMLTSRSGDKHRQMAMNLGARGYFSKPFKEQELLDTLAKV